MTELVLRIFCAICLNTLNNNTMGLDKNCMDKPYLIGRATALVESLVDVPVGFVAMVQINPLQKLTYHLREALRSGNKELVEVANAIGNIPSPFIDAKGQFYIGYNHQKSELERMNVRDELGRPYEPRIEDAVVR